MSTSGTAPGIERTAVVPSLQGRQSAQPDVLLFTRDGNLSETRLRALRTACPSVGLATSLPEPYDARVLVFVWEDLEPQERESLVRSYGQRTPPVPIIVLTSALKRTEVAPILALQLAWHVVAAPPDELSFDLSTAVKKLLRVDALGIEKHFSWGTHVETLEIMDSREKADVVARVERFASQFGARRRLAAQAMTVADELITNAIYNAPRNADGSALFANVPRNRAVSLGAERSVMLQLCCDGRRLGVAARDSYGSLLPETVVRYLAKGAGGGLDQVDTKTGGAGLGLFQVYDTVSAFIVNIAPGRCTETIGIFDIAGMHKDTVKRGKSFHMFVEP